VATGRDIDSGSLPPSAANPAPVEVETVLPDDESVGLKRNPKTPYSSFEFIYSLSYTVDPTFDAQFESYGHVPTDRSPYDEDPDLEPVAADDPPDLASPADVRSLSLDISDFELLTLTSNLLLAPCTRLNRRSAN
jgi:hypothetical protein